MAYHKQGSISRIEDGEIVSNYKFQHNPTSFTRSRKTKWVNLEAPGVTGSQVQFINVGESSMTLELFLSSHSVNTAFSEHGLRAHEAEIESWGLPSMNAFMVDDSHFISPPLLRFSWGKKQWRCHCKSVDFKYEAWNEKLDPIQMRATIQLETQTQSFLELQSIMTEVLVNRKELYGPLGMFGTGVP